MSYLESLRVFVRVVELGSITAGGRDMRLSPAAASTRIRDLEAKFGARLLNRTTRTLTPTQAILAVAVVSHLFAKVETVGDLDADFVKNLTAFWENYDALRGVRFKVLAVRDGQAAARLVGG